VIDDFFIQTNCQKKDTIKNTCNSLTALKSFKAVGSLNIMLFTSNKQDFNKIYFPQLTTNSFYCF